MNEGQKPAFPHRETIIKGGNVGGASLNPTKWDHDEMAKGAYMQADAMLKAGEK